MPATRTPRNVMQEKSLLPGPGISVFDEVDQVGFGFILRPVKTNFEKIKIDLKSILGLSGSGPSTPNPEQQETLRRIGFESLGRAEFSPTLRSAAQTKDLGRYILLPLPVNIIDSLSVNYATASLGGFAAGFAFGTDITRAVQDGSSVVDSSLDATNYAIRAAIASVGQGAATAFTGNVPNPFAANVFENVEPRAFNFQFNLQPKSANESDKIREIINWIRFYSLPEPNGYLLNVPWDWELGFLNTDYLYSFSRCALVRMEVNYTQTGGAVFFEGTNAPKDIVLNLEFREIFPLNQEVIKGFNGEGSVSMNPMSKTASGDIESGGAGAGETTSPDPETGQRPETPENAALQLQAQTQSIADQYSAEFDRWNAAVSSGNTEEAARYKTTVNQLRDQFNALVDTGSVNASGAPNTKLPGIP